MLKFNDDNNWFNKRVSGVVRAYKIPHDVKGIAVDIGANVGAFSYVNHMKFDKIIAIEPANETFNKCVLNTKNFSNVSVNRFAAHNKSGDIIKLSPFLDGNVSGNASTLRDSKYYELDTFEEVETISLEGIYKTFNLQKINYLKIDCEGGEYDFLMGKQLDDIDYIAIEIHIQLGNDKINELKNFISKTHNVINSIGNGITAHFEITYKNKKL